MIAARVVGALALLAAGFFGLYEVVEAPQSGAFAPVLTHGEGKQVALTFDDGPTRGITDRLLDVLERERAPATFFVVGRAARREPGLLRRMRDDGDEVENHSDSHPHLNVLLGPALDGELMRADAAVMAATGRRPAYLRPPFGARSAAVLEAARRDGLRVVLWSAMFPDRDVGQRAPRALDALLAQIGDGAIVVLHDGDQGRGDDGERAREAFLAAPIIDALRGRGYRLVTLDALLRTSANATR